MAGREDAGVQSVGTDLPGGIVTFVFTDIEGSTRLLRRLGDAYAGVLERHYEILREACAAHRGHDMGTAGDSLFVAFADAASAVEACAAAQRALTAETWVAEERLRVRMGIHTGLASPRGDHYVALAVHQAARVMSAAHGGQVLVSEDTVGHLGPIAGVDLVPVGRFRLRDFEGAVRLHALAGPGLASDFPAVRALPVDGHNLVAPPTSFVGRSAEVEQVASALRPGALLTLTGPGGSGKTRLATEVGLRVAPAWPDGVWLVDLAPVQDAAQLGAAVAAAVGAPARGGDRWDDALEHLEERRALVVLDNCEQLVRPCARSAEELLATCHGCGVLATSRVPLGTSRERVTRVGALAVEDAALELFVDRARRVRPDLVLDGRTAPVVAAICRALDGLPLAIELAAARLGVLSPAELLDGLADRFTLLRTSSVDVPARQQTMEGLLLWSDRLLTTAQRACLRRLGVFGSGFDLAAAGAPVAGGDIDPHDVPDLVWALVDASLLSADLTADHTRYRLLETVRAYARRRLAEEGETEAAARRLARWYLDRLGAGRRGHGWVDDVGAELDNLRALIPLVAPADPEAAQELGVIVGRHLDATGAFRDGIGELTRYVAELPSSTPTRVSLLVCLADLHLRCGDLGAADELAGAAEAVRVEVGAAPGWDDVAIERTRADLACRTGDHARAMRIAGMTLARELSPRGRARMCSLLGISASMAGDLETARTALERELEAYERLGDDHFAASAHGNLAELAMRAGDVKGAARHQWTCLTLGLTLGSAVLVAFSAMVAARIAAGRGEWVTAARLQANADGVLESTGLVLYEEDRVAGEAVVASAREHLGASGLEEVSATGRQLGLPEVAALAEDVLAAAALRQG